MGTADLGTSAESLSLLLNSSSDALLVIDVQQDFCLPTGSLYAADGDDGRQGIDSESTLPVLPAIFSLISTAHNHNITIVSTQGKEEEEEEIAMERKRETEGGRVGGRERERRCF